MPPKGWKKPKLPTELPRIGLPDPLEAMTSAYRNAQEGNLKLQRSIDALREGLETIVIAEVDNATRLPTTAADLRRLAVEALDAYSRLTGQSWRRHKLIGSYVGDRNLDRVDGYNNG
jgi:hypothetical protein